MVGPDTRGIARRGLAVVAAASLLLSACAREAGHDELTVFAAASLRTVADELEAAWSEAMPDVPLTVATDGSNVLAAQIAEGAPADVFLSADTIHPQRLVEQGWAVGPPVLFARNEVALVAGADSGITRASDIATPGVRLVVAGPSTPIGRYTEEAIAALADAETDPAAFTVAVEANIASREDNVRAALAKVELGEGDAAFVYRTDALGSDQTVEIELPPAARIGAEYAAVLTSDRGIGAEFLDWLRGPTAGAILTAAGFEVEP
jgi:molybdate transport system substrate-binding protein